MSNIKGKNIVVSDQVKAELEAIKESDGHKSLDSVVRDLIWKRNTGRDNLSE